MAEAAILRMVFMKISNAADGRKNNLAEFLPYVAVAN
jgi:hypothetical protein